MDLYAYASIGELEHYLTDNNIEISRLRGLRLMKDEQPVSDESLEEMIKEDQLQYAINWLQQRCDWCWSSSKQYNNHKSFTWKKDEEGDDYHVVAVDFSKVHGKNRKHIKFKWKKIAKAYHKQYDMWNEFAGKNILYVHARQGGGNRSSFPIDTTHPMYLCDVDDAWDSTYCDIYYNLEGSVCH